MISFTAIAGWPRRCSCSAMVGKLIHLGWTTMRRLTFWKLPSPQPLTNGLGFNAARLRNSRWICRATGLPPDECPDSGPSAGRRRLRLAERSGLRHDSWSTGQAEGQINRLKMIKRQMYGHAGFELLRARVLPYRSPVVSLSGPAFMSCTKSAEEPIVE